MIRHLHQVLVDLCHDALNEWLGQRLPEVTEHGRRGDEDQSIKSVRRHRCLKLFDNQRGKLAPEFATWIRVCFHTMTAVTQ